jgi:hypothetical protein
LYPGYLLEQCVENMAFLKIEGTIQLYIYIILPNDENSPKKYTGPNGPGVYCLLTIEIVRILFLVNE